MHIQKFQAALMTVVVKTDREYFLILKLLLLV